MARIVGAVASFVSVIDGLLVVLEWFSEWVAVAAFLEVKAGRRVPHSHAAQRSPGPPAAGPGAGRQAGRPRFFSGRGGAYTQPPCPVTLVVTVAASRFSSVGQSDSLVMNRSSVRFRQAAPRITTGQAPFSPESGAFPLPEACSDAPVVPPTFCAASHRLRSIRWP